MVNVTKSQPAPACLAIEKAKNNGTYNCGDVLKRLQTDFKNKCYLCESKPTSINIEHFEAHGGDLDKKFDWTNLFFVCGNCNNVKLGIFDFILNCTNADHKVDEWIKYDLKPYPKENPKIIALKEDEITLNTVKLLDRIYNGHTKNKEIAAGNLRDAILREIREFNAVLIEYCEKDYSEDYQSKLLEQIKYHLSTSSSFTAFKRWIVRDNAFLFEKFGKYCSATQHS